VASHCRLPFGRLTSSNVATWVLSAPVSNTAPQTSQDTWPLCGIKHVGSTRLYSAPHSHRTSVVSIFEICARNHPFSSVDNSHNQTDSLPAVAMSMIALASWLGSLGRLGCLSVIRLPQSFACQRSLVEVRPAIPVCILVGSVGFCVRAGLCGASDPWRSSAAIQILRGLVAVQTSLVPSREHTLQTVRFRVNNTATIKLTHYPGVP
jgi:hypothetical protein